MAANKDFLFRENIAQLDEVTDKLIRLEEERQTRKLIMIASESTGWA